MPALGKSTQGTATAAKAIASHGRTRPAGAAASPATAARPQTLQEMQHQQRAAGAGQGREQAHVALAERVLHRELRQKTAGERQAAEAQRQHRRRQQHRPEAAPAGRGDDADGEEQGTLGQDVVRRIEGRRHAGVAAARGQAHAEHGGDEPHLAHAGVGQHGLRVGCVMPSATPQYAVRRPARGERCRPSPAVRPRPAGSGSARSRPP